MRSLHRREVAGSKPAAPILEGPALRGLLRLGREDREGEIPCFGRNVGRNSGHTTTVHAARAAPAPLLAVRISACRCAGMLIGPPPPLACPLMTDIGRDAGPEGRRRLAGRRGQPARPR